MANRVDKVHDLLKEMVDFFRDNFNSSSEFLNASSARYFDGLLKTAEAALALPAEPPQNAPITEDEFQEAFNRICGETPEDINESDTKRLVDWINSRRGASATPCPECKRSDGRHEEGCTWDASATPAPRGMLKCARCGNGPIVEKDILCQVCAPRASTLAPSERPERFMPHADPDERWLGTCQKTYGDAPHYYMKGVCKGWTPIPRAAQP
jgi:hypothetical protein